MNRALRRNAPVEDASARQRRAADPSANVWVMASAGTGKTTVLVERFIRLILAGAEPEKILCLTYTKAAATQMKERVLRRLSAWTAKSDADLSAELAAMTEGAVDAALLAKGRGLFGALLDHVERLNIMTIHAFCQSLLARFQMEADLPGQADIADETDARILLEDVLNEVIETYGDPVIERMAQYTADSDWTDLVNLVVQNRHRFQDFLAGTPDAHTAINGVLDVTGQETVEDLRRAFLRDGVLPKTLLETLPPARGADPKRMLDRLTALDPQARASLFADYVGLFVTTTGTARQYKSDDPALAREYDRVTAHLERERSITTAACSRDLADFAALALSLYEERKRRRHRLDYDDLIHKTVQLLSDKDASAWIRFKLDGGIDHVLVDEAQDTSPVQWQIVAQIVQEYFAGEGRRAPRRTGPCSSSATSSNRFSAFRAPDPDSAAAYRFYFEKHFSAAKRLWNDVPLTTSSARRRTFSTWWMRSA